MKESISFCAQFAIVLFFQSLMASSQMLMSAVDRLKNAVNEANKKGSINFHNELSSLRKNWRLKKVSTSIVGDLSYRSGLSVFSP